ncbi:cupin domain-containing protein [Aridibaculum aurantiacum]|uniref:cupin domain-containing protein n=1 Tax=Aridibaculum aurantiacum TaxID=2810307 RepID=UPI001A95BFA7|nr:cupin domain-containing protein [Aridibaculum aurantiacum]
MIWKVNVKEKLQQVDDYWNPRIVGELNGQHVKLVKFQGPFVWHKHDHEDELFFVVEGQFIMELEDGNVELAEGDFIIIPKGTMHRPVADKEVHVMLFEPASTLNTGDAESDLTKTDLERL